MSIQACLLIFWLHIYLSWHSRDYTGNFPKFPLSTNCSTLSLTLFRRRVNCEMEHIFCFLMFAIQNIMVPRAINCLSVCFFFLTPVAKLSSSDWRSYRSRHWRRVCFQVLKTYITHSEVKGWNTWVENCMQSLSQVCQKKGMALLAGWPDPFCWGGSSGGARGLGSNPLT